MSIFESEKDFASLVEGCRRGDQRAWASLVQRLQGIAYNAARRVGLSDDDASDAFQSTFLALYRSLDRIDSPETLPKWVAVTALRESLRLKRLGARTATGTADLGLEELIADEESSAETLAVAEVRTDEVRQGLKQLGGKCADLLKLLYNDDDPSYADISRELGMPVGAIGPTRARCLEKLRKILEREGFFPG